MQTARQFFREHAGYSFKPDTETPAQGRDRCARRLAAAERWASSQGYAFQWQQDDYTSAEWLSNEDPAVIKNGGHWRTWQCLMRDPVNPALIAASLHCIDFGPGGDPWSSTQRRVVEAELALEVAE